MAPEIIEDPSSFSPAADVYSFAMVVWEMSTGESPNQGMDIGPIKFARRVLDEDYRPPMPRTGCPRFWLDIIEASEIFSVADLIRSAGTGVPNCGLLSAKFWTCCAVPT